MNNNTYRK